MKNFVQDGKTLTMTAPTGGVVSGGVYQIGQLTVVATHAAAEAADFTAMPLGGHGVFQVTKVGSQAWTEGLIVYFDKDNARWTSTATGSLRCGWAVKPLPGSGAGETTGYVLGCAMPVADEA